MNDRQDRHETEGASSTLSFAQLLERYCVVIPVIQRDYAQGRLGEAVREVRKAFRDALFGYLGGYRKGEPGANLDFVYGTLIKEGNGKQADDGNTARFVPLDGQQRLTTLFLLHWLVYQESDDEDAKARFRDVIQDDQGRSRFRYETRRSASEFCDALVESLCSGGRFVDLSRENGLSAEIEKNSLSAAIENESWFFRTWKNDPTIQSMLVMLDDMHDYYHNGAFEQSKSKFLTCLMDGAYPAITFEFLELDRFGLSDELYIRMNSRGKLLLPFEDFKAQLEQKLRSLKRDEGENPERQWELVFSSGRQRVSLDVYFSHKIDTVWLDLFWWYCRSGVQRDSAGKGADLAAELDRSMENFFRVWFCAVYVSRMDEPDRNQRIYDTCSLLRDRSRRLSFGQFEKAGVLRDDWIREAVVGVTDALDALCSGAKIRKEEAALGVTDALCSGEDGDGDTIGSKVVMESNKKCSGKDTIGRCLSELSEAYWWYFDEDAVFRKVLQNDLSRLELVRFYAYVRFRILSMQRKVAPEGIDDWMRVVCNMTHRENARMEDDLDLWHAIRAIDGMLESADDVLAYLRMRSSVEGLGYQSVEECIKARLFASPGWKECLMEAERRPYFNGQIGFLLEFAGVGTVSLADEVAGDAMKSAGALARFRRYYEVAKHVFMTQVGRRVNDRDCVFERAVLAKGDYVTGLMDHTHRSNLLSTDTVENNVKRDWSWKRWLRMGDGREGYDRRNGQVLKERVKAVFDAVIDSVGETGGMSSEAVMGGLDRLCVADTPDMWRNVLISYPELFGKSRKGFIRFDDDEQIVLYMQSQMNHYHAELFTWCLWTLWPKDRKDSLEEAGFMETDEPYKCPYREQRSYDLPFIGLTDGRYGVTVHARLAGRDFDGFVVSLGGPHEEAVFLEGVRPHGWPEPETKPEFVWPEGRMRFETGKPVDCPVSGVWVFRNIRDIASFEVASRAIWDGIGELASRLRDMRTLSAASGQAGG